MMNIQEMKVEDILKEIGINLTNRDVQIILENNAQAITEFEQLKREKVESEKNVFKKQIAYTSTIVEILKKYDSEIAKRYLILLTLYNFLSEIDKKSNDLTKEELRGMRKYMNNAIKMIENEDFNVIDLEFDKNLENVEKVKVVNSRELVRAVINKRALSNIQKPSRKQMERIKEIDAEIGLENIAQILNLSEIKNVIATSTDIGEAIITQISWNAVQDFKKVHTELDLSEEMKNGNMSKKAQDALMKSKEYKAAMAIAIRNNCKYIDIDKLLLLASYRILSALKCDTEESLRIIKITEEGPKPGTEEETIETAEELLRNMQERIKRGTTITAEENITREIETFTTEDLNQEMKRFRNRRYITQEQTETLKQKLLSGEETFFSVDQDVLATTELHEEDFIKIVQNSEDNIIYLIDKGTIEAQDMMSIIYMNGKCSDKLFAKIQEKTMLTQEEMIELFEVGIISAESIATINDEGKVKELKEYINKSVKSLYVYISKESDKVKPEDLELFNRYATLYKLFNIRGKNEEEIEETASELVSSFEEELDNDILEGLYQYGLITLEVAADWGVELTEMLAHNSIKPSDLKDLYNKQIISISEIKRVLKSKELDYEEKLDLIYSTFDGESEEDYKTREELVEILGIGEGYKAEGEKIGRTKSSTTLTKVREYITDPHARWKLISLIDKEYSKKFLPAGKEVTDGHRVFLLPNQEKILIEKMHEKRRGRKVSAYGSATYIMETEEFFKEIDEIIVDGAINRTMLRKLSETDKATKIIHSKGWGESIKRYFDIDEENERYTQEELEAINMAIRNVENSRKERS